MRKNKAIVFSFDDGVEQDKRLIEIFDRYGLRCTFNLNSGMFGMHTSHEAMLFGEMRVFNNRRIPRDECKEVYRNHEVAAHSVTHPILPSLSDGDLVWQVREDARALEEVIGRSISGLAYPGGYCTYFDDRTANLILQNTNLYYGRTAKSSHTFALPENPMIFFPTVSHREIEIRDRLADEFLQLETDEPQLFYIWGHSYELDVDEKIWAQFERFCEKIAGRDDILYATTDEAFRHFGLKKGI